MIYKLGLFLFLSSVQIFQSFKFLDLHSMSLYTIISIFFKIFWKKWVEICDNSFDTFLALNLKLIFSFSLQFQVLVVELSVMISSFHLHFLSYSCPFAIVLVIFDVLVHVFDFLWIFVCIFCSAVWLNVFLHQTVLFLAPSFSRPAFDFLILFSPYSVLQVRANQ